jgi:hypothetical protein
MACNKAQTEPAAFPDEGKTMKAPTININGDSKATLADEAIKAMEAMSEAIEAVNKMTVHGRNFPGDRAGHAQAVEDFARIYSTLRAIGEELQAYYIDIVDQ